MFPPVKTVCFDHLKVEKSNWCRNKTYGDSKTDTLLQRVPYSKRRLLKGAYVTHRDVVPTKRVWERTQKNSHFKTTSNSFQSKTWKRCGNAVPTRSRPTTPLVTQQVSFRLWKSAMHVCSPEICSSHPPNSKCWSFKAVVPNRGFPYPWGSKTKFSGVQTVIFEGESLHVLGCNFFQKRVIFVKAC